MIRSPIVKSWSSLVEIDEQLDRSNSQTSMELCHACDEKKFWGVQPSSPSTKEFHGEGSLQREMKLHRLKRIHLPVTHLAII